MSFFPHFCSKFKAKGIFLTPLKKNNNLQWVWVYAPCLRDLLKFFLFCCQNQRLSSIWGQSHSHDCGGCEEPLRRKVMGVVEKEDNSAQHRGKLALLRLRFGGLPWMVEIYILCDTGLHWVSVWRMVLDTKVGRWRQWQDLWLRLFSVQRTVVKGFFGHPGQECLVGRRQWHHNRGENGGFHRQKNNFSKMPTSQFQKSVTVTLYSKRDFTDVKWLRILRWEDCSGFIWVGPMWSQES